MRTLYLLVLILLIKYALSAQSISIGVRGEQYNVAAGSTTNSIIEYSKLTDFGLNFTLGLHFDNGRSISYLRGTLLDQDGFESLETDGFITTGGSNRPIRSLVYTDKTIQLLDRVGVKPMFMLQRINARNFNKLSTLTGSYVNSNPTDINGNPILYPLNFQATGTYTSRNNYVIIPGIDIILGKANKLFNIHFQAGYRFALSRPLKRVNVDYRLFDGTEQQLTIEETGGAVYLAFQVEYHMRFKFIKKVFK